MVGKWFSGFSSRFSWLVSSMSSRRSFLALAVLSSAGAVGCRGRSGSGVGDFAGSGGASGSSSASVPVAGGGVPVGFQELDGHMLGHHVTVGVSPLVRVDEATTALAVKFTRAGDDATLADVEQVWSAPEGDELTVSSYVDLPWSTTSAVVLLDPTAGTVRETAQKEEIVQGGAIILDAGESDTVYVPFGPVDDTDWVTVFMPMTGFVPVAVIDREGASDAGVDLAAMHEAIGRLSLDAGRADPVPVESFTRAVDESTSTLTGNKDVTVTLASDVTFDPDSDALTDQADGQLSAIADRLAEYPGGGGLDIVGHTDDIADEAYNQDLSERRARAIQTRLGQVADLSAWTVTASGRGESEPAVEGTSEEARAANRRVVVTMIPAAGTTAGSSAGPTAAGSSAESSARWPDPLGPVGDGPDGVTVTDPDDPGGQVSVTLERLTRTGGLLLGCLNVTTGPGGTGNTSTLRAWLRDYAVVMSNSRQEEGTADASYASSDGLTLLTGDQRLFPADYVPPNATTHTSLTESALSVDGPLNEGATTTICVVWPDTGQDTATLDHQGAKLFEDAYAFRLTNIPITQE